MPASSPPTTTTFWPASTGGRQAVEQLPGGSASASVGLQRARLEGAHTGCDEHVRATKGARWWWPTSKRAIGALLHHWSPAGRSVASVAPKGSDLLQQAVDQFTPGAHGHPGCRRSACRGRARCTGRRAQAARRPPRPCDLEQAQLEHLEQADRPGADDQRVGLDHGRVMGAAWLPQPAAGASAPGMLGQRISSDSLSLRSFQSSASGSGALRLVMLGQFLARSALSLMKATAGRRARLPRAGWR